MRHRQLSALLHLKILRTVSIHSINYISTLGAICFDLGGNGLVKRFRFFEAEAAVYEIVLIVNYHKKLFHSCSPLFIKKFFHCENIILGVVLHNEVIAENEHYFAVRN